MSSKANRVDFHNALIACVGNSVASSHIYFQPPENIKMEYPAIVYNRTGMKNIHADNINYMQGTEYQVTVIDKNPDSDIVDKISKFPSSKFNRHFTTSGLNHDVFTIIYK